MKLKIAVFAYNFKHWKTQTGLNNLFYNEIEPNVVIAANKKKLKINSSKKRTSPKNLFLTHPQQICQRMNFNYMISDHDSKELELFLEENKFDLGVILGARILNKEIIDKFKIGIINLHPGVLPLNRGLDTIKKAILNDLPQGVTSHLINHRIDMGSKIDFKKIPIYDDDTLIDIKIRLQNLEQQMLIESIKMLQNSDLQNLQLEKIAYHKYSSVISNEQDEKLEVFFSSYKKKWSNNEGATV